MSRLPQRLLGALASRYLAPLVLGLFLLIYIAIAFATDETLIVLIELTGGNPLLALLLALLPLNYLARLVLEARAFLERRRLLRGAAGEPAPGLFDESVELRTGAELEPLQGRLAALGYRTRLAGGGLAAWRGLSLFPARMLYLAGVVCLFSGILVSLTSRSSTRSPIIEGVRMPDPGGQGGVVERIEYAQAPGPILSRNLTLRVAGAGPGGGTKSYGLYPPALYQGAFVYPRYLGIGLHVRFSAPDLAAGYETHSVLAIYPPGKEAAAPVPDSPYQIVFSLAQPEDGSDPFMTGDMLVQFKLLKGKEQLMSGSVPAGGEFARDGYYLAVPEARRLVMTDFIRDYGVFLIWGAALLLLAALLTWLPLRLLWPRREMLFAPRPGSLSACSRAEGGERRHRGVFHETLDLLEAKGVSSCDGRGAPAAAPEFSQR